MFETTLWAAFAAGIVSALSMPLGAITALFWQPKNRVLAFLVAFGGGALLAAVTIDLVGNVKERGHLLELIVGSIIGSLFFIFINQLVNNAGGFLRKPSTLLTYLYQQDDHRNEQRLVQLKQHELFRYLPPEWLEKVSHSFGSVYYPKGSTLYQKGDRSESFYIIDEGAVDIINAQGTLPTQHLTVNHTFGIGEFLTKSPHQGMAIATQDTQLAVLSCADFEDLLETSPPLLESTEWLMQGEEIADYLRSYQGFSDAEIKDWVQRVVKTVHHERKLLPAIETDQKKVGFLQLARQIQGFPLFSYLPKEDLEEIADRLTYASLESGSIFFQPSEAADRFYILHDGEVEIVYPGHLGIPNQILKPGRVFGELAFLTGSPHTVTAIARTPASVWVFRKQDFHEMVQQSREFEESVGNFLKAPEMKDYLQKRQNVEATKSAEWVNHALESMHAGQLIPSARMISEDIQSHKNAPLSIWIGLLLDAIPEALTIGAQLAQHPISITLITGLFIANYPEALSSSKGMKEQGFSTARVLILWTSIMVITGTLAALGSVVFAESSESVVSFLESLAAGAMMTVIAETMLPEAYAMGGAIAGISTLLGFLVIITLTSFEP